MHSWGKFWTIRYKKTKKTQKKNNCHFSRAESRHRVLGAKAGYCTCPLHSTPPKSWAKHLSYPAGLTPGHNPSLTSCKEQTCPPSGSEQENMLLVFPPSCDLRSPRKALPEFLDWHVINFYWLGKAKNTGWCHPQSPCCSPPLWRAPMGWLSPWAASDLRQIARDGNQPCVSQS